MRAAKQTQRAAGNALRGCAAAGFAFFSHPMTSLHDLPYPEFERVLVADGLPATHARTLWRAVQRDGALNFSARGFFPPPLARWVAAHVGTGARFFFDEPAVAADTASSDGLTQKFLLRLADGQTIETVLMGYTGRST